VGAALALLGPALVGIHTWAYCSTIDFTQVDAWRRLWSDLAIATADYVNATEGPIQPEITGDRAEVEARGLIIERIVNQGLSPTRPFERVRKTQPFVEAKLGPEAKAYDDPGRAILLAFAYRVGGGIMPFLILWLGFLVAVPLLMWLALELWAAGRALVALLMVLILGLSPFFVESLALGRYSAGFYLIALLAIVPLGVYARLHPAPTLRGLGLRLLAAGLLLGLCTFCRSSCAVLWPGFVLAAGLGVFRVTSDWRRRIAFTAVAGIVLALPVLFVPGSQQNDMWQPLWEGLGDFDRTHGFTWRDIEALRVVQEHGVAELWTPESEAVLKSQVLEAIAAEPGWYAGILLKRLASTVTLWRLWPWTPWDGEFIHGSETPNEGGLGKYWTYTTTADFLGLGSYQVEAPVSLLVAPGVLLAALAFRGRRAAAAREALMVLACPALAALTLPVLVTTAGGQSGQALALVYLIAAAFLADVWRSGARVSR